MKKVAFSIDVEPDIRTGSYKGVYEGLPRLEKLLDKYNIKPTLFVTCDCIEKYPSIFKRLMKKGWEISLHGYRHTRFDVLTSEEKKDNLKKAIACFKKYLGILPSGFRAPQHSLDEDTTANALKAFKINYDSSLNPWNFYHLLFFWKIKVNQRYNFTKSSIHYRNGLMEIPISSCIMPFSSITLRIFPKSILRPFFFFISLKKNPVFFMHSWDLIKIKDSKLYNLCPLEDFLGRLEFLLEYLSNNCKFYTIDEIYHQFKLESKTLSHLTHMGVL
ncbi:MAG: polysaccharide deacetylase family protein [Nanoarchaeota archaeon]